MVCALAVKICCIFESRCQSRFVWSQRLSCLATGWGRERGLRKQKSTCGKNRGAFLFHSHWEGMARVTRLELAASGVTGRRSNQLSYARKMTIIRRAFVRPPPKPSQAASNDFNRFDILRRTHPPWNGNLTGICTELTLSAHFTPSIRFGFLHWGVSFYRIVDEFLLSYGAIGARSNFPHQISNKGIRTEKTTRGAR